MSAAQTPISTEPTYDEAALVELLRRTALGDREAFADLFRRTQAKLTGVVARILTAESSGDALQEVYVRIWEKAGEFDPGKGSPVGWMATIARNRALDEVRRVRPRSLEDMPENFEPAAADVDPLAARDRSERLAALLACLQALGEERRAVVLLAYYRGLSREALARRFDKPVPTIKTWLRRGLAELKGCLAQ